MTARTLHHNGGSGAVVPPIFATITGRPPPPANKGGWAHLDRVRPRHQSFARLNPHNYRPAPGLYTNPIIFPDKDTILRGTTDHCRTTEYIDEVNDLKIR